MSEFNFDTEFKIATWGIDRLMPHNHFIPIIAQSGVGKSLIVESIAISAICEVPFCGFEVQGGDVLILDQDTPTSTLNRRLRKLMIGISVKPKFKLYVESMKGYGLDDIPDILLTYPTVKYVIIDSLHSFCQASKRTKKAINANQTQDMQGLSVIKQNGLINDTIIIITHHISEKTEYSINDLMTGQANVLSMGNSAIMQQADTYFIIGATAENGKMNKAYIRPVSKRESIPTKPFVVEMVQNDDEIESEYLRFSGYYESGLTEAQRDILILFDSVDGDMTVKECFDKMGGQHGINKVREELKELYRLGKLEFKRESKNLFKYSKIGGDN